MKIEDARTLAQTVERYNEIENLVDRLTTNSRITLVIKGDAYITEFNISKESLLKEGIKKVLSEELHRLAGEISEV